MLTVTHYAVKSWIRLGKAARADVTDLDHRERVLLVRSGKRNKDRAVPVPGCAAGALHTYPTEARPELVTHVDGALFLTRHGGRLSLVGLQAAVKRQGRAIGVAVPPHVLRPHLRNAPSL